MLRFDHLDIVTGPELETPLESETLAKLSLSRVHTDRDFESGQPDFETFPGEGNSALEYPVNISDHLKVVVAGARVNSPYSKNKYES